MGVFRECVCGLTDIEASSVRTEVYYCKKVLIKQLQLQKKGIPLNQPNYKSLGKTHATEELVGRIKEIIFVLEFVN